MLLTAGELVDLRRINVVWAMHDVAECNTKPRAPAHFHASIHDARKPQEFRPMPMHVPTSSNSDHSVLRGTLAAPTTPAPLLKTAEEVQAEFHASPRSIAAWARMHGFNPTLAQMVIAGTRKCLRGQSLRIAVALGMKRDPAVVHPR